MNIQDLQPFFGMLEETAAINIVHEHNTHHRGQIRETPIAFDMREAQSTLSHGSIRHDASCCLRDFAHLLLGVGTRSTPSHARLDRERNAAYFTYLRFHESVRRMISRPTGSNGSIAAASAPCSCAELCLLPPPWLISWTLLPRRKQKGRIQDGLVISRSGRSSKTTKKNQARSQIPLKIGIPQAWGEGRRRILHTFPNITAWLWRGDRRPLSW